MLRTLVSLILLIVPEFCLAIDNPINGTFESGQFWETGVHPIRASGEAFRIESFGNSAFRFTIHNIEKVVLQAEGPYTYEESDTIPPCSEQSRFFLKSRDTEIILNLEKPGVYRLLVSAGKDCTEARRQVIRSQSQIDIACLENCARPEMNHVQLLQILKKNNELNPLVDIVEQQLDEGLGIQNSPNRPLNWDEIKKEFRTTFGGKGPIISKERIKELRKNIVPGQEKGDKVTGYILHSLSRVEMDALVTAVELGVEFNRNAIDRHFRSFINQNPMLAADRFPTIPHEWLTLVRHVAEAHKIPLGSEDRINGEDLMTLIRNEKPDRSSAETLPTAPDLSFNPYPDGALSSGAVAQSHVIAHVFNALSAVDPDSPDYNRMSFLRYNGETYSSLRDFIRQLIRDGHTITVRNEHAYVDILHLSSRGKSVQWPIWIDTGIKLHSGKQLTIPMGHSQYSFTIHGPVINARVAFYMDPRGAIFYPQVRRRAQWTGLRAISDIDSRKYPGTVLKALDIAGKILRRNHIEAHVERDLTLNGYGMTGVCNDSTSIIEWFVNNHRTSQYPIARSAVRRFNRLGDGLDSMLEVLPKDLTPRFIREPASRLNLLYRIYQMIPFGYGDEKHQNEFAAAPESTRIIDDDLADEMKEVRTELLEAGYKDDLDL